MCVSYFYSIFSLSWLVENYINYNEIQLFCFLDLQIAERKYSFFKRLCKGPQLADFTLK